jgi:hypothetical protein
MLHSDLATPSCFNRKVCQQCNWDMLSSLIKSTVSLLHAHTVKSLEPGPFQIFQLMHIFLLGKQHDFLVWLGSICFFFYFFLTWFPC